MKEDPTTPAGKNEYSLFFEVTGKCPYLTEMNRITAEREEAAEKFRALAKEFHEDAVPVYYTGSSMEMVGISVDPDKHPDLKIKGWRRRKQWGPGVFVPALNYKIGKETAKRMLDLKVVGRTDKLRKRVEHDFGKEAVNSRIAGNYLIEWGWGRYPTPDGDICVLRIIRSEKTEKQPTPRGLKKVKYSRVVELTELTAEVGAAHG